LGIPLPIWRTEDKQEEEILVGSVEELYNEIEKSIAAGIKENPFKGFEVGNMDDSNYDIIDLQKM
jgi:isoleucyl-tRNA synthetase